MNAWQLDVAGTDGVGLFVRLALHPDRAVAWYWTYLVLPSRPGPVAVRDHEVPLPRQGLEVRAEGLWAELWCEAPGEHWTFGLEAIGVRLDAPDDALTGELGERVPVGLDLEWEVDERAAPFRLGPAVGRFGNAFGDVLLGRERFALDHPAVFVEGALDVARWAWWAGPGVATHVEGAIPSEVAVEPRGRVLVPLDGAVLERTLVRVDAGAAGWSTERR